MDRRSFEEIVERTFDDLPENFRRAIDNLGVMVEDYPTDELVAQLRLPSKHHLLGLYQGVPLPSRGTGFGSTPVAPDTVSLYQNNIEAMCSDENELREKIFEVLIHEIGHYFGMSEEEIRKAGY